jgi:soluble lytic murein transglycosylase
MLFRPVRKIPAFFLSLSLLLSFASVSKASFFRPDENEAQIKKAVELIDSGNYRKAEELLLELQNNSASKGMSDFMLGILHRSEGDTDKAESYFLKASESYPLLREYALKLLSDIYIANEEYEKAVSTARKIESRLLKKDAMLIRIDSFLALKRYDRAKTELYEFINAYPGEWKYKWMLAKLLRERGEVREAAAIYKDLLISASPLFMEARKELKQLKADIITKRERLKLADNLFKRGEYRLAESNYRRAATGFIEPLRKRIRHQMAMCRFRMKDYDRAAEMFGMVESARARYWQARSYYRADDFSGFMRTLNELKNRYPDDRHYAKTLFIYADDFRRKGDVKAATEIFNRIAEDFPESAEEALWGIAWMNYTEGDYDTALETLDVLSAYHNSRDYHRYLYWRAKSIEHLNDGCGSSTEDKCEEIVIDFPKGLSVNGSYYGYLLKFRYGVGELPQKSDMSVPERPEGIAYEKMEALALLGMREEAVNELKAVLSKTRNKAGLLYLGYLAMALDEYKSIIRFAEGAEGDEFLPLSYPLAYRGIIKPASESKGIDPFLVLALIREESRFDPEALSWAGAYGLMQLMPATADRIKAQAGVELSDRSDLHDAEKNILIGTEYLSLVLDEFGELPFSIASYNAGENAVKGWQERFEGMEMDEIIEDIPYLETRKYVKRVLKSYWQYRALNGLDIDGF